MWLEFSEDDDLKERYRERFKGFRHEEMPDLPPGACHICGAPAGERCDAPLHS